MSKDHVLVIGDGILDVHLFGQTDRISPEAPVPIVNVTREVAVLGGAANVAAHITAAGIPCLYAFKSFAVEPRESKSLEVFEAMCSEKDIRTHQLCMPGMHPVTTKKRIWSGNHQVTRLDYEDVTPPDKFLMYKWLKEILELIDRYDIKVVVLSDYNKGTLTDEFIQMVVNSCFELGIKTILDPKRPTFTRLKRIDIVKPNKREILATNMTAEECSMAMSGAKYSTFLVNTLGPEGMVVWQDGQVVFTCPTIAKEVADVTGCGDSVCALLGIALFNGYTTEEAVIAANHAASLTIKHIGCYCPTKEEIEECLQKARDADYLCELRGKIGKTNNIQ